MLEGCFAAAGELEDREVLAEFVRRRHLTYVGGKEGVYSLVGVWSGEELVGVRDGYVDLDDEAGLCLAALSHSYVSPAWRRKGVASLLRAIPVTLARVVMQESGVDLPILLAAEMEPVELSVPETVVRLAAFGSAGFSVLDPHRFRYSQPDFRAGPTSGHTGLPMLGVVRPVGLPPEALPVAFAEVFPRLFHACHRMYLPSAQVDPSESHAIATLRASTEPVRYFPLPRGADDAERLRPLLRGNVLPLYPVGLRGPADRGRSTP